MEKISFFCQRDLQPANDLLLLYFLILLPFVPILVRNDFSTRVCSDLPQLMQIAFFDFV
jgi:hypothetical protein